MKRTVLGLLAWLGLLAAVRAGMGDKIYLVKIADHDKKVTYEIKSLAELKALQSEIMAENKYFQKALATARKEWETDEETAKKPFPSAAIGQRQVSTVGQPYDDRDKAQAKLDGYISRTSEKEAEEEKKEADRTKGQDKDQLKKERQEAEARKKLEASAVDLVRSKLDELKGVSAPAAK
jgi:hypothetical protein